MPGRTDTFVHHGLPGWFVSSGSGGVRDSCFLNSDSVGMSPSECIGSVDFLIVIDVCLEHLEISGVAEGGYWLGEKESRVEP